MSDGPDFHAFHQSPALQFPSFVKVGAFMLQPLVQRSPASLQFTDRHTHSTKTCSLQSPASLQHLTDPRFILLQNAMQLLQSDKENLHITAQTHEMNSYIHTYTKANAQSDTKIFVRSHLLSAGYSHRRALEISDSSSYHN